ncbi:MAG: tandem-95 repeat protein, partial [Candidatus Thorarchaeota archaeon]
QTYPQHGTWAIGSNGFFNYYPPANWYGTDSFTYRVFDGTAYSGIVTVTVIVNPVNDAPVAVDDYIIIDEDTSVIIDFMANDYDIDSSFDWYSITRYISELHGTADILHNYEVSPGVFRTVISYTPDPNWHGSTSALWYTIWDSVAVSETAYIHITVNPVNDAPVASDDYYIVDEDTTLTIDAPSGILANDTDIDGDLLTAALLSGTSHGSLTINSDGSFIYTPDPNWNGMDSFIYEISDGDQTDTATVTITVNPVDDPPVAVDDYVTTDEDTPIIIDVMANDYDVDGDPFDIFAYGYSYAEIHGQLSLVTVDGRRMFRFVPDPNYHGPARFHYTIHTTGVTGSIPIDNGNVYITVNPVNDAPVGVDDSYTIDEDTSLSLPPPGLLSNDYDVDGDLITLDFQTFPKHGAWAIGSNGLFNYEPFDDWYGTDSFTYRVYDGMEYSEAVTVTITVNPVNDAPVTEDDAYTTDEDIVLVVDAATGVLANDADVDGDALSVQIVSGVSNGHLVFNADGSFTYTPDFNWYGVDSFVYEVSDGSLTDTATTTITVDPVNDAPVAADDAYTTYEDTTLLIDELTGILANDHDVEGSALIASVDSGPSHGTLSLNPDGSYSYTSYADWFGVDSFIYEVSDGMLTDTATVTITVNSVNDVPLAVNDTYSTLEDITLIVVPPGVLANDFDIDGDSLTAVLIDLPLHGIVLLEPDGAFTYIPNPDYYGFDTFTYLAFDGTEYSDKAFVIIEVIYVNTPPTAYDDAYTTEAGVSLIVDAPGVLANDIDVDEEDILEAILIASPLHGMVVLSPNGWLNYTPDAAWCGVDTFTYYVFDGREYSNIALVTITVIDVKPPVTTIQFTGVEGEHGWYHSDVEVTLTATDDASGVASTVYSLDGSTWIPYSGPFVLTNSGEVTVYYYSTDNAGNVEEVKSATIKICKPTRSFVTGGGWIYDSGGKGHFTFVVKYKCNVLKGHLIYSFRADGYKYIVKSTHFFGMAIDENHALLEGKAKILRYNYETKKWQCFGDFYFRVEIWDNGKCKRD